MAFLTYVLVAGVIMGTSAASATAEFSAGELGTLLSNAWGFLLVEVLVCYAGVWLLNLADITIYDIVAYTGYKFIGMVLTLLSYLGTNNDMVFHAVLLWTAAALSFNLVQTIRHASDSVSCARFSVSRKGNTSPAPLPPLPGCVMHVCAGRAREGATYGKEGVHRCGYPPRESTWQLTTRRCCRCRSPRCFRPHKQPKLLYFAIGLVTAQVFFMWWFTSSVTTPVAVPELAAKLRKGPGMGMGKASRN